MKRIRILLAWIAYQRAIRAYRESDLFRDYAIERAVAGDQHERRARELKIRASS